MSQYNPGDLESPLSGTNFINTHFEPTIEALETNHSGSSAPSYVKAGMIWVNTTTDPWVLNIYDGAANIALGTVNIADNLFIPSNQIKWGGTAAGTAQAVTITPSPAITAYTAGMAYEFIVNTPNTAENPTININGQGSKTIKCYIGSGKANLPKGALQGLARIVYDGTDFVLINIRPNNIASSIATAATVDLNNANGDYVELTGTTTVTDITLDEGQQKTVRCAAAFILTDGSGNSPQDIILPGASNITTTAGDVFLIRGEANGTTRIVGYLRADGSAITGGGGSRTLLATVDASDDTTVEFDDTYLTSDYKSYVIECVGVVPAVDDGDLYVRTSNDGGVTFDSGGSDYSGSVTRTSSGSSSPSNQTFDGAYIRPSLFGGAGIGSAAGENGNLTLTLNDPLNTALFTTIKHQWNAVISSSAFMASAWGSSVRRAAEAVDGVQIYLDSGNIASGTFKLYGVS